MDATEVKEMVLLSGNEAIARAAFEAGVRFASAYPGTPSTEILQNISAYKEHINCRWSSNEATAFEAAYGAAIAGARSLCAMKHVGLNVAMDPFMTSAQGGINGGFVIVVADDPSMHSSQNEQDSRNLARFGRLGLFEPSNSADALEFTRMAFELSERFDLPFMIRMTTRISHTKTLVKQGERTDTPVKDLALDFTKYVMLPQNARVLREKLEDKQAKLLEFSEEFNRKGMEMKGTKLGIITSSVAYNYARDAYPEASILKLGLTNPLPKKLIAEFAGKVDELLIVEELDPFMEEQIKAMGIKCKGKETVPAIGELNIDRVKPESKDLIDFGVELPKRPPVLCAGCSHRGAYWALKKQKAIVAGDIGCYTLAAIPPIAMMHTCACMGASIGLANGLYPFLPAEKKNKLVATIGDSTFWHSGINGIVEAVYNNSKYTIMILDNTTTAMTGHQDHPSTGRHLDGSEANKLDIPAFCKALGISFVKEFDPFNIEAGSNIIKEAMDYDGLAVLIAKAPCIVRYREAIKSPYKVDLDKCQACGACSRIGCPAITRRSSDNKAVIDPLLCTGCSVCAQVCPPNFKAIGPVQA